MSKRLLQVLALAVCLGLLPAAAYAKAGKPADKGKSSSDHGSKNKDTDKHHDDNDRDEHHAGRGHGHEHESAAGPANRPPGWDKGNKTGWGDCNVPPGLARQRGCDSSGRSARERSAYAHHNEVQPQTRSATTNATTRPGETRGIILQRNATNGRTTTATTTSNPKATQAGQRGGIILQSNATNGRTTTATTTSTPKATQAGQRGGIILQRNATKSAGQTKTAAPK